MAPRRVTPSQTSDAHEEMTVVILRLKGGGDTLKKGFDALASAFSSLGPASQMIRLTSGNGSKSPGVAQVEAEQFVDEEEGIDENTILEADTAQDQPVPRPRSKPKFLADFDLTGNGQGWQEFAASKAPKSDNEKYLLAALWLTENAGVADFTVSHIFTCFRALKWNEQSDFSQPLRAMKLKSSYFSNPSRKTYRLTQPGLAAAKSVSGS